MSLDYRFSLIEKSFNKKLNDRFNFYLENDKFNNSIKRKNVGNLYFIDNKNNNLFFNKEIEKEIIFTVKNKIILNLTELLKNPEIGLFFFNKLKENKNFVLDLLIENELFTKELNEFFNKNQTVYYLFDFEINSLDIGFNISLIIKTEKAQKTIHLFSVQKDEFYLG